MSLEHLKLSWMALLLVRNVKEWILDSTKTCFTAKCQFAADEWNLRKYLLENKFGTVSQLNNNKRWRDLIAPFFHLDICFLRGLPATQEQDCCCAGWSASGCGASSCSPGKLPLFCSLVLPWDLMLELGSYHEDPRLWIPNSPFRCKCNVWYSSSKWIQRFKRPKSCFSNTVFETSLAFACFLEYHWREFLFLVL